MTYNPNIPGPNDILSKSQSDIQTNFSQANTIFGLDHFTFNNNTAANRGLHQFISFPVALGSNPSLGSLAGILYPRTKTGNTELYFKNGVDATQITSAGLPIWKAGTTGGTGIVGGTVVTAGPTAMGNGNGDLNNYGNMILPTGLEFKWGWVEPTGGAVDNKFFQFPSAFASSLLQVFIQGIKNSSSANSITVFDNTSNSDFNKTGFTLRSNNTWNAGFFFFAIGL